MTTAKSLGDRMKAYERAFDHRLPNRMPVIIRVDGRAFHTWTRGLQTPMSEGLMEVMDSAAHQIVSEADGGVFAYVQSDEISVLVHTYRQFSSEPWLANRLQKLASIAASTAGSVVSMQSGALHGFPRLASFDGRAFVLPESEVCNYFLWRQRDCERNSVLSLAQHHFSAKQMHKKNCGELQDMIHEAGDNWNNWPTGFKRGRCVYRVEGKGVVIDREPPQFGKDRHYVERHLETVES